MTHARPVHLHIDELVLLGFPAGERHRIHDAVQRALAEMIGSGVLMLPQRLASIAVVDVAPQTTKLRNLASAHEVGNVVAQSVLGGVGAALGPMRGRQR